MNILINNFEVENEGVIKVERNERVDRDKRKERADANKIE